MGTMGIYQYKVSTGCKMKLVISPKDTMSKIVLDNVDSFALEGATLSIVFGCGKTRNYPLQHIWYYQSHIDNHATGVVK
jgi:hypothetical protein